MYSGKPEFLQSVQAEVKHQVVWRLCYALIKQTPQFYYLILDFQDNAPPKCGSLGRQQWKWSGLGAGLVILWSNVMWKCYKITVIVTSQYNTGMVPMTNSYLTMRETTKLFTWMRLTELFIPKAAHRLIFWWENCKVEISSMTCGL